MIQMPVIDLPQNEYGFEDVSTYKKETIKFNQQKIWKNITKDVLNPFVSSLKPLVSQKTELDKVIGNIDLKFKSIYQRKGLKEKFERMKDTLTIETANPPITQNRDRRQQGEQLIPISELSEQKQIIENVHNKCGYLTKIQKIIYFVNIQQLKKINQKFTIVKLLQIVIFFIFLLRQNIIDYKPLGASPFNIIQDEDNNGKNQKFLRQQEYQRSNNSNRGSSNLIPTSPQNSKNAPSSFGQALQIQITGQGNNGALTQNTAQIKNDNSDVFEILDRKYRKKYNTEYKMQLRRKSCFCTKCGACTRYELKYQNIVNPVLIRKKKRLNKVFKAVNFINKMGKTMKQLPSQIEIENSESQSRVNNPSLENQIDSLGEIRHSLKNTPQTRPSKMDPPSLRLIEKRNTFEENDLKISNRNNNLQIQETQNNQSEQPGKNTNRIRKSFTLHVDEDVKQKMKNDLKGHYNGSQSSNDDDGDDEEEDEFDIYDRQQQSFAIEINSEQDMSSSRRHKVVDIRSKGKKQSYIQQKSSFLNFIDKKIKDAKKKRLEEETKYVGKTPLTVLMQILSQGKKNSVYNNTQEQEKKIQKFIENRISHLNIHHNQQLQQTNNQKVSNEKQLSHNHLNSANVLSEIGTQQNLNKNQIQQFSSSLLSNKNVVDDENNVNFDDQLHSERERLNSAASNYNITPLAYLKRKTNKLQQQRTQRERGFYISPVQQRTFDQMSSQQSNRSNGFNSAKKQFLLDVAVNPVQIVKNEIKQQKERMDPYLKQEVSQKQEVKKIMTLREYKLNTPCSSQRNRQMTSHSTQRQINTAQTTDRSSILSGSNSKQNENKHRNIRENKIYINNGFQTSRSNLNGTEHQLSRDKIGTSQTVVNNSFNQSQYKNKPTSKLLSPRFKQLLDDTALTNKCTPYIKQMFPINKISKSPDYKASQTSSQLTSSKSFRFFKSNQTNYQ